MRGVVYLVYEAGNYALALDIVSDLRGRGLSEPVLFSPYYLPDTPAYVARAGERGIAYVYECTPKGAWADPFAQLAARRWGGAVVAPPPATVPDPRAGGLRRARLALAARGLRARADQVAQWEAFYRSRIDVAARFLAACGARSVVLPEDNVERDSACWSRAARAIGGRATVVSYGAMNPNEAAIAYYENPDYAVRDGGDRSFARLFPRWRTRYRGREMLRLPAARALAVERLGLAPADPWIVNTGEVDAIAVESEYMRERFVEHGVPAARVRATGHAAFDALAATTARRGGIREQWLREHGCAPGQPVLLCAMPPDQYPHVRAFEFATFRDLVDGWLEDVAALRPDFFPMVSPHPNIAQEHRDRIRAAGVPVLEGGVANWLPACDLYVASVSSTIKWALACGKPTVNYDCYDYRHTDYEGLDGVLPARTRAQFREALAGFRDGGRFTRAAVAAQAAAGRYGQLDGRAGDRIAALVRAD